MKPLTIFGGMLIAIGIAGLAIDNISFTERKTIVDAGPLKVTADEQRTIPIPTVAGVIAVVAGVVAFGIASVMVPGLLPTHNLALAFIAALSSLGVWLVLRQARIVAA